MTAAELLIGPLLRQVVGSQATIWVEVSQPATVTVRAGAAQGQTETFSAYGHHYALVVVEGLAAGSPVPYQVALDGQLVWPEAESTFPPSTIRTRVDPAAPVELVFGSCREATARTSSRNLPPDALDAYAQRLATGSDRPDLLVLLGDQVYADETSPGVRRRLRKRRRPAHAPTDQVMTFDEYAILYHESWRDPEIRWLLSTVPSVMIFDDHEIIDDWNSSAAWRRDIRDLPWWSERISNGLSSYWIYQHLGNVAPADVATDPVFTAVTAAAADATDALREFAARADAGDYRFSYTHRIGATRLVMVDNRVGRVLTPGQRSMLPERDWHWLEQVMAEPADHLVIGSSLPWLMPPAVHHLEAWTERLADSPRPVARWVGEGLRRAVDLEHWPAFQAAFEQLAGLLRERSTATDGPASLNVLSGDVHHSYVAQALLGGTHRPVHQLTCSPLYNQVPAVMRPLLRLGWGPVLRRAARMLARSAGVTRSSVRWRRLAGPYFGNAVSTLTLAGRSATVRIEGTRKGGDLRTVAELTLTDKPR